MSYSTGLIWEDKKNFHYDYKVVSSLLAGAFVTAGISQFTPVLAISKQKQQLLDKIFAEEEDARNETSAAWKRTKK